MNRPRPCLALSILIAWPVLAQSDADPKLTEQAFLAQLTEVDESLVGTTHFGIYLRNGKNAGQLALEVGPGPSGEAAYQVSSKGRIVLGPNTQSIVEHHLLNADMSLALRDVRITRLAKGQETETRTRATIRDGEWLLQQTVGDRRAEARALAKGPDHWQQPSLLLLARKLAGSAPAKLTFRGLRWKKRPSEQSEFLDISVTVLTPEDGVHRGVPVRAQTMTFELPGRETLKVQVDGEGRLLSIDFPGAPIHMVAGTEAQCRLNLDLSEPDAGPPPGGPEAAVFVYLQVLAKARPVEDLDAVMDWGALQRNLVKTNPGFEGLDAKAMGKVMRRSIAQKAGLLTTEKAARMIDNMSAEVDGDAATIPLPGGGKAFRLRRDGEGWKITDLPR